MTYRPKSSSKKAYILSFASAIFAIILFATSAFVSRFNGLYQITALILAMYSVQVYLKYIASDYIYEAAGNSFKIYKITGKKSICVCSLDYEGSLSQVIPFSQYKSSKGDYPKYAFSVNYNKNIRPDNLYVYMFEFNSKVSLMKFEPDDVFVEYINNKIDAALGRRNNQEDF